MDFISNNRIVLGVFAVASFISACVYLIRGKQSGEAVLPIVPGESEISEFKTVLTSKIFQHKQIIHGGQFDDAQLKEVVPQIVAHILAKTRQIDRQDILKSRELRDTNFGVHVRKLLGWLKQKQLKIEELQQEQWHFINSLPITQEEKAKINKDVGEHVKKERLANISPSYLRLAQIYLVNKKNYLDNNGQKLTADLAAACQSWSKLDLEYVPAILDFIIHRNIENQEPELIDNQSQIVLAIEFFQTQLQPQIAACQQEMGRLFRKIKRAVVQWEYK